MCFAALTVHKKMGKSAAYAKLAEDAGVTIEAIKKALNKYGNEAVRYAEGARFTPKTKS